MTLSYGYICRKTSPKITAFGHSPIEVVHPPSAPRLSAGTKLRRRARIRPNFIQCIMTLQGLDR